MQFLWFKTINKKSLNLTSTLIVLGYKHTQTKHNSSFYMLYMSTSIYNNVIRIHKYKPKYYIYNHITGKRIYKNINKNTLNYLVTLL